MRRSGTRNDQFCASFGAVDLLTQTPLSLGRGEKFCVRIRENGRDVDFGAVVHCTGIHN